MQDLKNATTLRVETWPIFWEVIGEILFKILGLYIVYLIFDFIGKWIEVGDVTSNTLLSIVVLPAIYVLKDAYAIFTPFNIP
jgi:hypothetical protein